MCIRDRSFAFRAGMHILRVVVGRWQRQADSLDQQAIDDEAVAERCQSQTQEAEANGFRKAAA
eukprot:7420751-Lingulodinium_polyedra.AAC.1